MNMLIDFKKFHIKILVHMKKTYDVTIDHMVHFVGSKLGLYVSFLIRLYLIHPVEQAVFRTLNFNLKSKTK